MPLEDRKDAEESKYKHKQELAFKIRNRRNRLFGVWLAEEHLGKTGEDALAYAKEVVMADFDKPGDDDVFEKVKKDLKEAGKEISDHLLQKHLHECEAVAKEQVMKE